MHKCITQSDIYSLVTVTTLVNISLPIIQIGNLNNELYSLMISLCVLDDMYKHPNSIQNIIKEKYVNAIDKSDFIIFLFRILLNSRTNTVILMANVAIIVLYITSFNGTVGRPISVKTPRSNSNNGSYCI